MARHRLTAEDIDDFEDVDCKDPYLGQLLARFSVAGEYDEDYG